MCNNSKIFDVRKILVKHFALGTWVVFGGVKFHFLRAARVLFPATVFTGLIVTGDPSNWDWYWYSYVTFAIYIILLWIGGGWFPFSYFRIWPAQMEEMDVEQQFDYLRAIDMGHVKNPETGKFELTEAQRMTMGLHENFLHRRYHGKYHNLHNLLPLLVSILAIVGYVIYWGFLI